MVSIGEFARLVGVSVRMLRHYDRLGLLEPARVDEYTGYRSYSTAQLDRANRLVALKDAGRLLLAGPCPAIDAEDPGPAGFSGSIVIAEFGSLDAARAWADADPYVDAGVYARVDVRPFRPVLP